MIRVIWFVLFALFAGYTGLVYTQCDAHAPAKMDGRIADGFKTWQDKNCQSCHQLYGLGGYMGPDLTNSISEKGDLNARTFIQYGSGKMPNYHLSENEVNDLVAFLAWVDKSGRAKVSASSVHWTGTYKLSEQ